MDRIEKIYFKHGDKYSTGANLPIERTITNQPMRTVGKHEIVENKHFVQCDFHVSCDEVCFRDCEFTNCSSMWNLTNMVDCVKHGLIA